MPWMWQKTIKVNKSQFSDASYSKKKKKRRRRRKGSKKKEIEKEKKF